MPLKRLQVISFFIVLLAVLVLAILVLRPFLDIVAFGIILAILFQPVYVRLLQELKSANFAALLTVLIVLVIILIPILFFGNLLFNEAVSLYTKVHNGDLVLHRDQIVQSLPGSLQNLLENFSRDLNVYLARISSNAFQSFSSIVTNVASFIIALFVLFLTLFYLLRDGGRIKKFFMDISPMAARQENVLIDRIISAVNGVVKGSFLTALSQGALATVGFFIFGIPEPFLWGIFTVLVALVPTVGTSLAIIPAIIYLLITGHAPQALGMAIWGVLGVGLIDNFLGPRFVGTRTQLHPLLVLLSVLGGLQFFGPLGFLIGPILMAVFIALVDMYRTDFKEYVEQ